MSVGKGPQFLPGHPQESTSEGAMTRTVGPPEPFFTLEQHYSRHLFQLVGSQAISWSAY